ncbi:MAG: O-antigen ligase family protein [Pyrinomonadaceae bacterium]
MTEATQIRNTRLLEILQNRSSRNFKWLALFSLAHLPLGVLIYLAGPFAILHPATVLVVGLYWAANTRFRLERVALAIAYLVGAEVLWRMAGVPVFWEFGKYGSAIIAIVAMVKRRHFHIPKLPLIYFVLLIPGCLLILPQKDIAAIQATLSFQMSGPFFLLVASWFFYHTKFSPLQVRQLLFVIVVPLLSVAFAALFFTVTTEEIQFTGESNFSTSGGFGPNQVSAMLGLGAFITTSCLLIFQNTSRYRVYLMLAAIFLSAQSVMTFSRGGISNAIGGIAVVAILEFQRPSVAVRRILPILLLVVVFFALVFPVMNNFTDGQLKERFEDVGTSARTEIAASDLQLFWENPLFGVGVGAAYVLREPILDRKAVSHTEFSRLLAEHGMFGAVALLLMAAMIILNFLRQQTLLGRAFIAGVVVWCCLFMANTGMRMAAPSFMWGLMFVTIVNRRPESKRLRSDPRLRPTRFRSGHFPSTPDQNGKNEET